jgi:hypothetical protein
MKESILRLRNKLGEIDWISGEWSCSADGHYY